MVKLAAAVLSFAFLSQGVEMQPPTITLTPLPPTQGGTLTITYSGTPGTTLELDWDPPGQPDKVKVGQNGSVDVTVPDNADSLIVTDPTPNGALAAATSVTPA